MEFRFKDKDEVTFAVGEWSDYKYGINYSYILTTLIQQCGRLCDRYASDLFIDWKRIDETLQTKEGDIDEPVYIEYVFGIRRDGVDHKEFIESRLRNSSNSDTYRDIYLLRIVKMGDSVKMEFGLCYCRMP